MSEHILWETIKEQKEKIAGLKKENEYQKQARNIAENAVVDLCKKNAEQKNQLSKAKEIIKSIIMFDVNYTNEEDLKLRCELFDKVMEEAEQFLKEIEK